MKIGGLHKASLIEFPGKVSAVVFVQGCNFRCPFCYNPELVEPGCFEPPIPWEDVAAFLGRRRRLLGGVTFTGGEPLLQEDLAERMAEVRSLGFAVKLDTNGSLPETLARLLKTGLLDAVAMDIKGAPARYGEIARVPVDVATVRESVRLVRKSAAWHEFRTTALKRFLSDEDAREIAALVSGARRFAFQRFRPARTLDPAFAGEEPCPEADLERYRRIVAGHVGDCIVR